MDRVTPDWVERELGDLTYPVTRADAAAALADTDVEVDGAERNLGRLVSQAGSDAFHDSEHLIDDLHAVVEDEPDGHPGAGV